MKDKIEIPVTGVVMGFPYDDEGEKDARARLVLDAEMHGNEGKARIHLSVTKPRVANHSELRRVELEEACRAAQAILKGSDREHALVNTTDQTTISDLLAAALEN